MFQFHGQYFQYSFHGIPSAVFAAEFTFTTYLLLKFYAFSTSRGQIKEAGVRPPAPEHRAPEHFNPVI